MQVSAVCWKDIGGFRANQFEIARERWQELAEGQQPRAIVIACCCDAPGRPGDHLRYQPWRDFRASANVANLVPPFETGGGRHGFLLRWSSG